MKWWTTAKPRAMVREESPLLRAEGWLTIPSMDLAQALETVVEELLPDVFHNTEQYANNRVECDRGRLKSRLRPMRGLKTDQTASVVIRGHAFIQNLRRGHYELGVDAQCQHLRVATAFDELTTTI